jgi:hypothetical protein
MQMEEDLIWIQETCIEHLMYNRSVEKTSYDKGSVSEMVTSVVWDDGLKIHGKIP